MAAKCGHCLGEHNTRDCTDTTAKRCVNCSSQKKPDGHKAWSPTCQVRVATRNQLKEKLWQLPLWFSTDSLRDLRKEVIELKRKPGRLKAEMEQLQQEDPLAASGPPSGVKRPRQSTLSFVGG